MLVETTLWAFLSQYVPFYLFALVQFVALNAIQEQRKVASMSVREPAEIYVSQNAKSCKVCYLVAGTLFGASSCGWVTVVTPCG
jgi:hypothetical protein